MNQSYLLLLFYKVINRCNCRDPLLLSSKSLHLLCHQSKKLTSISVMLIHIKIKIGTVRYCEGAAV